MKNKTVDEASSRVLMRARYPIIFNENDTSLVMINKGIYTFVDDPFKDERNLIPPPARRRLNIEIINFRESVTEADVFSFLADLGKQPASPEHLFALGYQYPSLFRDLLKHLEELQRLTYSKPKAPDETDWSPVIERIITRKKLVAIAIGRAMSTRVADLSVFPALTYNDSFGAGMNLVGYHTMIDRTWDPHYFFLAIPADD